MKPKILFMAPFPPPMGGIANQSQMLVDSSQFNMRYSVHQVKTNPYRNTEEPGKRGRWLSFWSIKLLYHAIADSIRINPKIVFLRANGDISLIRNGIVAIITAVISDVPLLMYIQISKKGSWIHRSALNKLGDWILSRIVSYADVLIHLSENANSAFVSRGWPAADYIIPNAVIIPEGTSRGGKCPDHFCFIGRLSFEKGFFDILQALEDTELRSVNWTFHVIGLPQNDEDTAIIGNKLKTHPCRHKIKLHGYKSKDEVRILLQKCAFMVFPSHKENFPNAILEGMVAAQAIIATRVGEIPGILKDDTWMPIEIGDIQGISNSIKYLLENQELTAHMGERNRKHADRFSFSNICTSLCDIIDSLCNK